MYRNTNAFTRSENCKIKKKNAHLSDIIIITDHDTKKDLPVHVILGAGDYTKINYKREPG